MKTNKQYKTEKGRNLYKVNAIAFVASTTQAKHTEMRTNTSMQHSPVTKYYRF